jgi:hypothetical protein
MLLQHVSSLKLLSSGSRMLLQHFSALKVISSGSRMLLQNVSALKVSSSGIRMLLQHVSTLKGLSSGSMNFTFSHFTFYWSGCENVPVVLPEDEICRCRTVLIMKWCELYYVCALVFCFVSAVSVYSNVSQLRLCKTSFGIPREIVDETDEKF